MGKRKSDDNQMSIFDFMNNQENPEMTKDYAECEKLGLKGAVRKNEKGQWEEVKL